MKLVRTREELASAVAGSGSVGFVPTMGALHEGHLHLLRTAALENRTVVCSIFVNPTQFGPGEDFRSYPRQASRDVALAAEAGCRIAFLPSAETVYQNSSTTVHVGGVSERFEGALRPGHFDGVATVVHKLFGLVRPHRAYFGYKDLQQCAVVRKMVADLFLAVDLRFVETVRSSTGVALSSRNSYLSPTQLDHLARFSETLRSAADRCLLLNQPGEIDEVLDLTAAELAGHGFGVDYLDIVDPQTMASVRQVCADSRVLSAVNYAGVRFLDNMPLSP